MPAKNRQTSFLMRFTTVLMYFLGNKRVKLLVHIRILCGKYKSAKTKV